MFRGTIQVEPKDLLHVGRQLNRSIRVGADRRHPLLAQEHHPDEFLAPRVAGKDFRCGERMTTSAGDACLLLSR